MGAFHVPKRPLCGWKNGFGTSVGLFIPLPLSSVRENLDWSACNWRWVIYVALIFMIIVCSSVNNFPFIYFQF